MLKLHGFPVSNYTNMVELALREKELPFEYVMTIPAQTPEFLAKSPRGKVPVLGTPQGFINETMAILQYLEDLGQGKPLLHGAPRAPLSAHEHASGEHSAGPGEEGSMELPWTRTRAARGVQPD